MADQSRTHFDDSLTRFIDADRNWGPLLFLRPRPEQSLSVLRIIALSILTGTAFGLLGSVLLALAARIAERPALPLLAFPVAMTAIYFLTSQLTFVPAWNRRAERLARNRV